MIYANVIIVGGGPAGSICASELKKHGYDCLILDKHEFPRNKLCAGWIQQDVFDMVGVCEQDYPHSITRLLNFNVHIGSRLIKMKMRQYAIRRTEFDAWLLYRANVRIKHHKVRKIQKDGDYYVIDGQYYCNFIVGAGGTRCPVYKSFFTKLNPRKMDLMINTLEDEIAAQNEGEECHLWFFQHKFPGYFWYVPKKEGYINVGLGGFQAKLKKKNDNLKRHWDWLVAELERLGLADRSSLNPRGHYYFLRNSADNFQQDRVYIIGDAAALATRDMGEGIAPAIKSGFLAAEAIANGHELKYNSIRKYSLPKYKLMKNMTKAFLLNRTADLT
ncbi:MAG: NAD(P)/FAD-dependent oxidoreductase [Bacteroidales bacterium]|nr:NAD(P)/FAD-dependent oxidoreductase [Bacteroidales bacterium]